MTASDTEEDIVSDCIIDDMFNRSNDLVSFFMASSPYYASKNHTVDNALFEPEK